MPGPDFEPHRTLLASALRDAYLVRLGVPPALETLVRAHARSLRESGVPIEKAVVAVKTIVREETGGDEGIFLGKVVGWAIAGYFAGTTRTPPGHDE